MEVGKIYKIDHKLVKIIKIIGRVAFFKVIKEGKLVGKIESIEF